ncbi:MAG: hypothetical protein LIQ30_08395 [Planctomycetes bacterium]|nr:hypothetical protein [Planctomycetota bacterium]MCC8116779.1 hypothetical protein [Planctomycetota bacterium]MCD7896450.1 hypothetical protein [Planctomycetaceae bacterium]
MTDELTENDDDNFYTLVPEQGLCLVGDAIINLKMVTVIRKLDGKTLVYSSGAAEPIILPVSAFEAVKNAVFAMDDLDDDDDFEEEPEEGDDE